MGSPFKSTGESADSPMTVARRRGRFYNPSGALPEPFGFAQGRLLRAERPTARRSFSSRLAALACCSPAGPASVSPAQGIMRSLCSSFKYANVLRRIYSLATNCGPLSEMIRGRAWGNFPRARCNTISTSAGSPSPAYSRTRLLAHPRTDVTDPLQPNRPLQGTIAVMVEESFPKGGAV